MECKRRMWSLSNMIKVYTGAAVNGNPGDVGLGVLVLKDGEQIPFKIPVEEKMDNHLAEIHSHSLGIRLVAGERIPRRTDFHAYRFQSNR